MTSGVDTKNGESLPGYAAIVSLAWPIILANTAHPLLGLVDTAVIGNLGDVADLGAIALGALIVSFVYWTFGFLRMGTTGFVAQAEGAGDNAEVRTVFAQASLMALSLGGVVVAARGPLSDTAFALLSGSAGVEATASDYLRIRLLGAPAALVTFAAMGTLIGLGRTRALLALQLFLNVLNMALDILFAGKLGWGAVGIAAGTALAEWAAMIAAVVAVLRILDGNRDRDESFFPPARLRDPSRWRRLVTSNGDIMVRTLCMLTCFGWFANAGARFGDHVLAANHILQQLISFSAFFLDGFALAAESLVGKAVGRRDRGLLDVVVRRSMALAVGTSCALGAAVLLTGGDVVRLLTDLEAVRQVAWSYLPWTALYVALSFAAFQYDGIYIGATRTRAMRNASFFSAVGFLVCAWPAAERLGNTGLWAAFCVYVALRGLTLRIAYPRLRDELTDASTPVAAG